MTYNFDVIDRVASPADFDVIVQAEDWRGVDGHRTHVAVAIWREGTDEDFTIVVESAEHARRLKNLFAKIERRLA